MYKYIFIFFFSILIPAAALAQPDSETFNLAGLGALTSTSPYDGVSAQTRPIPFLSGEYKGFYIKGIEAGYHFLKAEQFTLSVFGSPRLMGYSSEDSSALNGMEDRRMSMDAGIKAAHTFPWQDVTLTIKAMTDVMSRSKGSVYELSFGREVRGSIFRLMPSLGLRYQDKPLVNYYYGVADQEVRASRPAYEPRGSVNPFAHVIFSCGISKKLIVVTMLGVESLGESVRKSPIVDKGYGLTAAAGLSYKF